ncbi:MAG: hypothetical protein J5730_00705 [Bacteroidales bacterium]|nr:hypothetical protein [Bacteroidales bacterium]
MNIKNITNLLKAYFIENWKTDLFQLGILSAVILIGSILNGGVEDMSSFAMTVAVIFLIIYPERLFRNLHGNSSKIHYLTIPASNGEKVVANMLLTNIYFVAVVVLACALGLGLAHLYLTARGMGGLRFQPNTYWDRILVIYAGLSVFFFGSIYFRKRTTLTTFGVGLLIITLFSVLFTVTMFANGMMLIPKDAAFHDYLWNFNFSFSLSDKASSVLAYITVAVVIIYFYVLSFLRMKETEA